MYCLSDKQIDYILNDICARGVEMESLQENLLDHICCIIEQNLEANGNFEVFYQKTITTFYKDALWEIEEETLTLLTFKNYYVMKKIMIASGIFSAVTLSIGIIFKFNHWPGTVIFIAAGILCASLLFLPLLFILKIKEKQKTKEKLILGIGLVPAVSISLAIIFKVMHWPGANFLGMLSVGVMLLAFLPVYFFSGIKNPETKINTIVSSVLIIIGCGLFLTLVNTRPQIQESANIQANQYLQNSYENITRQSNSLYEAWLNTTSENKSELVALNERCDHVCERIEHLKLELLNKTENRNAKTINYEEFGKLENFDIPTSILFKDKMANPELMVLKRELESLDNMVHSGLKMNTPVTFFEKANSKNEEAASWETANFYNTPLNYILRNLTQVQINIRCIEMGCIASQGVNTLHASR